jgi:hypothetical protein
VGSELALEPLNPYYTVGNQKLSEVLLEEVLNLVKQLKLVDKVRLIERVAPQIERELA